VGELFEAIGIVFTDDEIDSDNGLPVDEVDHAVPADFLLQCEIVEVVGITEGIREPAGILGVTARMIAMRRAMRGMP